MDRNDQVFAVFDKQAMIGCLRIARIFTPQELPQLAIPNTTSDGQAVTENDKECRLLRAVFIAPDYRGSGIAKTIISFALKNNDFEQIWTFPYTHLIELYRNLGFNEQEEHECPRTVRTTFNQYKAQGRSISIMRWLASRS